MGLLERVRWPASTDVALAVAFAVGAEVELRLYDLPIAEGHVSTTLDSVLVLVPVAALAWRRAVPFAAVLALPLLTSAVGLAGGTVLFFATMLPFVLLMYVAATWARSPLHVVALVAVVLLLGPMAAYAPGFGPNDWAFGSAVGIAAWAAGQGARRWRHRSQQLARALADAEAGRSAVAELAVAAERARIARELHDVVAHAMSVVVMQAGAARPAVEDDPQLVATALDRIEEVGRNAMVEMRRLLGILRDDEADERHPQPDLDTLPVLLEELGTAGLSVEHRVHGEPVTLSDAADVSAYRIVQEALTNALRHGSGGRAELTLSWLADRLRIEVSNPVAASAATGGGGGHGLVGVRERVAIFDGEVSAGPGDGRYLLVADLPYGGAPA